MKHLFPIFALAAFLLASVPASAQISIDEVNAEQQSVTFQDKLKSTSVDVDYFNLARYKAERAAIRKERNYLEFGGGLQGTLTSYNDPWISISGGDNSIALVATFNLRHVFKKNLFSIETKFNAKLGYNRMKVETQRIGPDGQPMVDESGNKIMDSEGVWFKNQDELVIRVNPAFEMAKNWSYGSIIQFRSQFVNGYKSRSEQEKKHLKSKFMTPAYLDISLGITYKSPEKKFPITVNMSPLALNATFAESDWIRKRQVDGDGKEIKPAYPYGIEDPDGPRNTRAVRPIEIDFDRTFGKTGYLRYRTTISSVSTAGSLTSARGTRSAITVSIWRLSRSGMRETRISRTNPACRSIPRPLDKYARHQGDEIPHHDVEFPVVLQQCAERRCADQNPAERRSDVYL